MRQPTHCALMIDRSSINLSIGGRSLARLCEVQGGRVHTRYKHSISDTSTIRALHVAINKHDTPSRHQPRLLMVTFAIGFVFTVASSSHFRCQSRCYWLTLCCRRFAVDDYYVYNAAMQLLTAQPHTTQAYAHTHTHARRSWVATRTAAAVHELACQTCSLAATTCIQARASIASHPSCRSRLRTLAVSAQAVERLFSTRLLLASGSRVFSRIITITSPLPSPYLLFS